MGQKSRSGVVHILIRQLKLTAMEKKTNLTDLFCNSLLPAPLGVIIFLVNGEQCEQCAVHERQTGGNNLVTAQ